MGLFDRTSTKAERKRLAPLLGPDEQLIETDVCELVTAGMQVSPGPVVLSLTDRAIYVRSTAKDAEALRIPYEQVIAVQAEGPELGFSTSTGNDYLLQGAAITSGEKDALIDSEMRRRESHRQSVPLPRGSTAVLICRPLDEGGVPVWISAGYFNRDDPANRAEIEKALAPAFRLFGPINWSS
jgi:hypothetical protein